MHICAGPLLFVNYPCMNKIYLLIAVCLTSLGIGCGENRPKAPLPNMFPSLDALAAAVVAAVQDSSTEKLLSFCVTEQEYRDIVWANLDSSETSQPAMPVERAWSWVVRDSEKAAQRYVAEFGGRELQMTKTTPPQRVREYEKMKVHRAMRISVAVGGAAEEEWRLLNVVLEYQGWFKVITYND